MNIKLIFMGFLILIIGLVMLSPGKTLRLVGVESSIGMDKVTGNVVSSLTERSELEKERFDKFFIVLPYIIITIGIMTIISSSRLNLP